MEPDYTRLRAAMGEEGALYAYYDDSYLLAKLQRMAEVLAHVPSIFGKFDLRIGLGPGKTELILLEGYDESALPCPLDDPGVAAPHVVPGFSACLGVPRHFSNDQEFISRALQDLGVKHNRSVDLRGGSVRVPPTSPSVRCQKVWPCAQCGPAPKCDGFR